MTAERGQSSLVKIHGKPGNEYRLGGGGALVSQTPREGLQQVKETERNTEVLPASPAWD